MCSRTSLRKCVLRCYLFYRVIYENVKKTGSQMRVIKRDKWGKKDEFYFAPIFIKEQPPSLS